MAQQRIPSELAGGEGEKLSLPADLRLLAEDARAYAEAELKFQKARAGVAGSAARAIAIWIGMALALMFFALMALIIGAILALTPLLTAWGAMAVVTGVLLLVALISALLAIRRWRAMKAALQLGRGEP